MEANEVESVYNRLREQGYTEDQIEQIIGLGGLGQEQEGLQRQYDYADTLRNQPGPEGRMAGNVYVAQNPLEEIAGVGQHYVGEKLTQNAKARDSEIRDEQMRRRMEYLKRKKNNEPIVAPTQLPGAAPGQILV